MNLCRQCDLNQIQYIIATKTCAGFINIKIPILFSELKSFNFQYNVKILTEK